MMIHEITAKVGRYRPRKRIGRGHGSGQGCTAGRGHKGAKSRSGWKNRPNYEGGQMPYFRRIPKRGFSNVNFRRNFVIVNLKALEAHCDDGAEVTPASLAKLGLVRDAAQPVKVLGEGELTKKLDVTAAKFSASAREKIEKAGGSATVNNRAKWTRQPNGSAAKKPSRSQEDG